MEHTHAIVCMWRLEDNLQELILSLYHVGPLNLPQVFRLDGKCFH